MSRLSSHVFSQENCCSRLWGPLCSLWPFTPALRTVALRSFASCHRFLLALTSARSTVEVGPSKPSSGEGSRPHASGEGEAVSLHYGQTRTVQRGAQRVQSLLPHRVASAIHNHRLPYRSHRKECTMNLSDLPNSPFINTSLSSARSLVTPPQLSLDISSCLYLHPPSRLWP